MFNEIFLLLVHPITTQPPLPYGGEQCFSCTFSYQPEAVACKQWSCACSQELLVLGRGAATLTRCGRLPSRTVVGTQPVIGIFGLH
jgi:hypothetical protein